MRRQSLHVLQATLVLVASFFLVNTAIAQGNFFAGKTMRFIVGFSAGGGYDTYTRLVARHMSKHIPGNPAIIVENMTGAGSMIAANYIYKVAEPDGLSIAHFIGGLFLQQIFGKPGIEFDARKYEFVGVPAQDNFILFVSKDAGITDVTQWIESIPPESIRAHPRLSLYFAWARMLSAQVVQRPSASPISSTFNGVSTAASTVCGRPSSSPRGLRRPTMRAASVFMVQRIPVRRRT